MKTKGSSLFYRGLDCTSSESPADGRSLGEGSLRGQRKSGGFTLVEVVLALGVIACAFVPIMSLLPFGLDVSRQAMDVTVSAQVVQLLTGESMQMDFSELDTLNSAPVSYYDDQGNQCTGGASDAVYAAGFTVSTNTVLPNGVGSTGVDTSKLKTVTINFLNTKAGRTDKVSDPKTSRDAKKFVLLIPDNGR